MVLLQKKIMHTLPYELEEEKNVNKNKMINLLKETYLYKLIN
jgi:hypothetical protein